MPNITNMPINFTTLGNWSTWLNTVTNDAFWTVIIGVVGYIVLFMLLVRWGTKGAILVTTWIMMVIILIIDSQATGLLDNRMPLLSVGLFLGAAAFYIFSGAYKR